MRFLRKIADEKIRKAMESGEFDNLAGHGKPLNLDDLSTVPEDLRLGYKILKNAGFLPPEMELKKEFLTLQELIKQCTTAEEAEKLRKKHRQKVMEYRILMERRGSRK